jgi:hypothetical protein
MNHHVNIVGKLYKQLFYIYSMDNPIVESYYYSAVANNEDYEILFLGIYTSIEQATNVVDTHKQMKTIGINFINELYYNYFIFRSRLNEIGPHINEKVVFSSIASHACNKCFETKLT